MNNKLALIAVFLVFLLPVMIATLMHSEWFDWQPAGMRNHGELVQPVLPIQDFEVSLADDDAVVLDRAALLDRWMLVYYHPASCAEVCLENLYWLRQIRRAQDRHQPDVGLVFAAREPASADTRDHILGLAGDFLILAGPEAETFWTQLPGDGVNAAFFILDPVGNIIMRYPEDADHNGIRRDLRRLLTWTRRD